MTAAKEHTIGLITHGRRAGQKAEILGKADSSRLNILTENGKKRTMNALHVFPLHDETGPLQVHGGEKKTRTKKGNDA